MKNEHQLFLTVSNVSDLNQKYSGTQENFLRKALSFFFSGTGGNKERQKERGAMLQRA